MEGAQLAAPACTQGTVWNSASNLQAFHLLHTATLLPDNSVLIVGGYSPAAERFNPSSSAWTSAGASLRYRRNHSATRLADGRVLVAGGAEGELDTSAEVYDPVSNSWSHTGSMAAPRRSHSSTLLSDGSILVAGGTDTAGVPSAERYEPGAGTWTPTGPMGTPRRNHTATLLPDGRVLVGGGEDSQGNRLASVEVYTPSTGTWTSVAPLSQPRTYHTATALSDGSVLVVGGALGAAAATAEVYNPATDTWASTASMAHPRRYHTATALSDGSVLVAGGYDDSSGILTSVERYTPESGSWCQAAPMAVARYGHTATVLQGGQVLVAAGFTNTQSSSAELHGPPGDCDAIAPRLTLSSPPEGFVTRESPLTLAGSVDDASSTVTVNGSPIPLTGSSFTSSVPLVEGANTLQVIAEDACHNRTTLVRHVRRDSTPPSLSFLQPAPGSTLNQLSAEVLLTYADESSGLDPASFKLLLDGTEVSGLLTHAASSAYGTVPLSAGPHTLVARVADLAGNLAQAQVQVQVVVEQPPITVTLTRPTTGASFTAPASMRLAAAASTSAGSIGHVDFLRDGVVVGSASAPPYEVLLSDVPAGTYVFRARAVDDKGGAVVSGPATVTVKPLVLTITTPVPNALVSEEVLVQGTFQAPAGAGVTVNERIAAIKGNTFLVRVPVEPEGATTLTATLTAPEGQSVTQTVVVVASGETLPVEVQLRPSSGFAPLTVEFMLTNRLEQPVMFMFDGSGPYELPASSEAALSLVYPAGVHTASIDFLEESGRSTRQTFVIEAIDEDALDQRLRAMWAATNEALVAGDKERALTLLSPSARNKYGPVFDKLLPRMPSIVASYSPLQRASLSPELGEYAVNRTLGGVNRIFFIYFDRDHQGVWHLSAM